MAQMQRGSAGVVQDRADIPGLIRAAAAKYRIPEALLSALVQVESSGNPKAVSKKGAMGLGQLMPATAEALGVVDPFDPAENLNATAKHLSNLLTKYGGKTVLALAAYNAGEPAVDKVKGVPDYPETVNYIKKIDKALTKQPNSTAVDAPPGSPLERTPVGPRRTGGDYIAVDRGGRSPDQPLTAEGQPYPRERTPVGPRGPKNGVWEVDRGGRHMPVDASSPRDPGYGLTVQGASAPTQQNSANTEAPGLGKISDRAMQQVLDQLATERATVPMDVDLGRQYTELQPGPYGMADDPVEAASSVSQPSVASFYSGGTFPSAPSLGGLSRFFKPSGGPTFADYTPSER